MYVYFIQAFGVQELKRIKIGMSDNPANRLMELQVGSPVKLKMLGSVRCKSRAHAASVERLAHNLFHKQRRRGEWFHLSRKHLVQIKSLIERAAEESAPPKCAECGTHWADPPSALCPGCEAYRAHTGAM